MDYGGRVCSLCRKLGLWFNSNNNSVWKQHQAAAACYDEMGKKVQSAAWSTQKEHVIE